MTDQMVDYALQQCKGKHDQAVDVLQSGLSMQPEGGGVDAARLWVAKGSVEADCCKWDAALECAQKAEWSLVTPDPSCMTPASIAVTAGGPQVGLVRGAAARLAVQTLLTMGRDEEASSTCTAALRAAQPAPAEGSGASTGSPVRMDSLSLSLTLSHALGQQQAAELAANMLTTALEASWAEQAAQGTLGTEAVPSRVQAAALLAAADWHARRGGDANKAGTLYKQAAELGATTTAPGSHLLVDEVRPAALMGAAQLAVAAEQWDAAEEQLGHALTAAEGLSSDRHPRTALPLVLLGYVYARSARITFAEGLFRECAKILKVDAMQSQASSAPPSAHTSCVHPSVVALLSWRYHQLLAALPKRGKEAEAWELLAQRCWAHAGPALAGVASSSITHVLGSSNMLTGKGHPGTGLLISLPLRRVLPLVLHA